MASTESGYDFLSISGTVVKKYASIIGIIISILALLYAFHLIDWNIFLNALTNINFFLVFVGIMIILLGVIIRSYRWGIILNSQNSIFSLFHGYCIGYLGNMIFPARAGELIRARYIKNELKVSSGYAISSVISDRLMDGIAFVFFLYLFIWLIGERYLSHADSLHIFAIGLIVCSLFLVLFIRKGAHYQSILLCWTRFLPVRVSQIIDNWYTQAYSGLSGILHLPNIGKILFLSIICFAIDAIAFWEISCSLSMNLPIIAGISLMLFISAGTMIPSAPGYTGIYQIAAIFALTPYQIDTTSAIAFSFLLQAVNVFTFFIIGGAGLWKEIERKQVEH